MVIIKVLKRKDASSIVVAIIVALIVIGPLNQFTMELTNEISGTKDIFPTAGNFNATYLSPTVSAVLQLLALEILCWLYILANKLLKNLPAVASKKK